MPSIFTSTKFFQLPIDHQSTSNDRLKPVMTAGLVNMHIDRSIANLAFYHTLPPFEKLMLTFNICHKIHRPWPGFKSFFKVYMEKRNVP